MTRSEEEYVVQQLIDTCGDINLKSLGEAIGESESMMRGYYHGTGKRSMTPRMEKKIREIIDQKIRNLIKIIKFIDKHQFV